MLFLAEQCTGCRTCQLVCSLTHEGECGPSLARLVLRAKGLQFEAEFTPACDECAKCAAFCPYGAIERGK